MFTLTSFRNPAMINKLRNFSAINTISPGRFSRQFSSRDDSAKKISAFCFLGGCGSSFTGCMRSEINIFIPSKNLLIRKDHTRNTKNPNNRFTVMLNEGQSLSAETTQFPIKISEDLVEKMQNNFDLKIALGLKSDQLRQEEYEQGREHDLIYRSIANLEKKAFSKARNEIDHLHLKSDPNN